MSKATLQEINVKELATEKYLDYCESRYYTYLGSAFAASGPIFSALMYDPSLAKYPGAISALYFVSLYTLLTGGAFTLSCHLKSKRQAKEIDSVYAEGFTKKTSRELIKRVTKYTLSLGRCKPTSDLF